MIVRTKDDYIAYLTACGLLVTGQETRAELREAYAFVRETQRLIGVVE